MCLRITLVVSLLFATLPAVAEAQEGRILLVTIDAPFEVNRPLLLAKIADDLDAEGVGTVGPAELDPADQRCEESDCLLELAGRLGARRILIVEFHGLEGRSHSWTLHLWPSKREAAREARARPGGCESCDGTRVRELVVAQAHALLDDLPVSVPLPLVLAPAPVAASSSDSYLRLRRSLPFALLGVGAAGLGFGGWLIYADGANGCGTACGHATNTLLPDAMLMATGAALSGAAAWLLYRDKRSSGLAIQADGRRVSLAFLGSF